MSTSFFEKLVRLFESKGYATRRIAQLTSSEYQWPGVYYRLATGESVQANPEHAPGAEPEVTMSCEHKELVRGKDIPRRYGSYRSQICTSCGNFRAMDHYNVPVSGYPGRWRPTAEYESTCCPLD